jgi:hypothetical protein
MSGQEEGMEEILARSFHLIAGSTTSQAFMVDIDNNPIFEIELHKSEAYPFSRDNHVDASGDFVICIASDWIQESPMVYAECIRNCLSFFSQSWKVSRLLIDDRILPLAFTQAILPMIINPDPGFLGRDHPFSTLLSHFWRQNG